MNRELGHKCSIEYFAQTDPFQLVNRVDMVYYTPTEEWATLLSYTQSETIEPNHIRHSQHSSALSNPTSKLCKDSTLNSNQEKGGMEAMKR